MKKLFAVIAVLAVMLSFAGCGGTKYEVSDYDTAATNDLVQLFIKQRTVTDETEEVTLTIENLTDKDYTYDAGQRLEIWQDGHWCVIPDKQDFVTMQLFTLPGNATDEVTFSFVNHYDKQIVLFNVVELDSERRITAVVRANVFSVEIHFCGGICTVDLQIYLFSTWKILLFQLFHKATCSAEIVVSAVLSVFTVPCVRQI